MNRYTKFGGVALAVVALMIASPAFADKGGKGSGRGSEHGSDDHGYEIKHEVEHGIEYETERHHSSGHDDGMTVIRIGDDDRGVLHHYLEDSHKKDCTPGLAKKHNGCLPPGQAMKYAIGDRLPDDVVFVPVPHDILERLHPAPTGYKYVRVDSDVLLIGEASKKIIDVVTLLSGVGR
jgi:Ni/Co efflux regulator RcnB